MNRIEAHALLNAAKTGHPVTEWQITEALRATGDLNRRPPKQRFADYAHIDCDDCMPVLCSAECREAA